MIDALADTFPAVFRLVGEPFFRFAAREFASAHPPRRRSTLTTYGVSFPGFLRDFEPAAPVPYLADVALLEYSYLSAYHAAEATRPIRPGLEGAAAEDRPPRLALHPSARLMTSPYPVSRIWEVNRRRAAIEGKLRFSHEREHLLVIRPDATVEVRRVSRAAWAALLTIRQGSGYDAALEAGVRADPQCDVEGELDALAAGGTFCLKGDPI